MSDTSNAFGFGKLVPGFDFLQSLAKGASGAMPQLPSLSNWVAPTLSVQELEKRVGELKAVQFWLEQNSRALAATIQALEVQKMTLATLDGMNVSMGDLARAFQPQGRPAADEDARAQPSERPGPADSRAGAGEPASASGRGSEGPAPEKDEAAAGAAPGVIDPMQWWSALTGQFQQIAANALKDPATQNAIEKTHSMATGLAQDAFKTASDMAQQLAAAGQGARKRAAAGPAASAGASAKKAGAAKTSAARGQRGAADVAAASSSPRGAKAAARGKGAAGTSANASARASNTAKRPR